MKSRFLLIPNEWQIEAMLTDVLYPTSGDEKNTEKPVDSTPRLLMTSVERKVLGCSSSWIQLSLLESNNRKIAELRECERK